MDDIKFEALDGFEAEIQALKKDVAELRAENGRIKEVIVENGLEEEIADIDCSSIEEKICINGIQHIAQLVRDQDFDDKDVKNFQVLFNVLRSIKGKEPSDTRKKSADVKKLMSIVSGNK